MEGWVGVDGTDGGGETVPYVGAGHWEGTPSELRPASFDGSGPSSGAAKLAYCCYKAGNSGDIAYSLSSSMLLHDVILTSFSVHLFTVPVIFSLCKTRTHRSRATVAVLRQEMPEFIATNLWPKSAQISILRITKSGLSCSVVPTTDKPIVWMN